MLRKINEIEYGRPIIENVYGMLYEKLKNREINKMSTSICGDSQNALFIAPKTKILINGNFVELSTRDKITVDSVDYYNVSDDSETKKIEGTLYATGDLLYVKNGEKTSVIHNQDDTYDFMTKKYSYNSGSSSFNTNFYNSYLNVY